MCAFTWRWEVRETTYIKWIVYLTLSISTISTIVKISFSKHSTCLSSTNFQQQLPNKTEQNQRINITRTVFCERTLWLHFWKWCYWFIRFIDLNEKILLNSLYNGSWATNIILILECYDLNSILYLCPYIHKNIHLYFKTVRSNFFSTKILEISTSKNSKIM